MKIFFYFFLFFSLSLQAQTTQQIRFDIITNENGLPSNSVSCAMEDKQGFMWFGTRKGLSRYDGYEFKNYTDKWVYGIAQGLDGTIYASTVEERLISIDPITQKITIIDGEVDGGAFHTFVDSYGDVWYSDRVGINRYNPSTKKISRYPLKKTTYVWHKGRIIEDKNKHIWILGLEVGLLKYDRKADKLALIFGLDKPRKNLFDVKGYGELYQGFAEENNNIWIGLGTRGLLNYDINNDSFRIISSPEIPSIFSLAKGKDINQNDIYWFGTDKGVGTFNPKTEKFEMLPSVIPTNFDVNQIINTKNGNMWFCTSSGVLLFNPYKQAIQTFTLPPLFSEVKNKLTNAILKDKSDASGNTFWILSAYTGLWKWNRKNNDITSFPIPKINSSFEGLWLSQDANNKIWIGGNNWKSNDNPNKIAENKEGVFVFDPYKKSYLPTPFKIHQSFFSAPFFSVGKVDSKNRLWLINHYESIHVIDLKTGKEIYPWEKSSHEAIMKNGNWIMDILEDKNGKFWFPTYQGFWYFDESARKFVRNDLATNEFEESNSLMKVNQAPDGNIWVAGWHMVAKLSASGKVLKEWGDKDGIYDMETRNIAIDNQNQAWIGNYDGLHRLDQKTDKILRLTKADGLMSNNTTAGFLMNDNELIVGQNNGWNTINTNKMAELKPVSNLQFSQIMVNRKNISSNTTTETILDRDQNDIIFAFSALNFEKSYLNNYQYYLENWDEKWQNSLQNNVAFSNLAPGSYTFKVRKTDELKNELTFKFKIKPYWYETIWSKLLLFTVLSSLFVYFMISQNKYKKLFTKLKLEETERIKKGEELIEIEKTFQQRIFQTEITALRAQMNPHFIFNCLNSIQLFTAQNNSEKASEYLSKFSKLIRLVLENSMTEKITLDNELTTLRLYVEMEAMRFKGKIRFEMAIADNVDVNYIQIPPLLIQPFVENAIWHGLMHKEDGGKVSIEVSLPTDNLLHIEISDDGVGREKANEYKSKSATKNKSFGMKVTAERIELINQLYNTFTNVQIIDLKNKKNEAIGTKVIVEIPIES